MAALYNVLDLSFISYKFTLTFTFPSIPLSVLPSLPPNSLSLPFPPPPPSFSSIPTLLPLPLFSVGTKMSISLGMRLGAH